MAPPITRQHQGIARRLVNEQMAGEAGGLFDGPSKTHLIAQMAERIAAGQSEANARAEIRAYVQSEQQRAQQAQAAERQAILSTPLGAVSPATSPPAGAAPPGTPAAGAKKPMTLSEGFSSAVKAYLSTPIDPKDFRITEGKQAGQFDHAAYGQAQSEWATELSGLMESAQKAQELQTGIIRLPDGNGGEVVLDVHDPSLERDPQLAAQMAAYFSNQDRDLQNNWTMTLHKLDLDEYAGAVAATSLANSNASKAFQDALELVQNRVSIGQANQETAVKEIERTLKGMAESRARAGQAETELSAAAGWASPSGKTSFSGNDLGAGVAGLARFGGLDAAAPLLQFAGTRQTDPLGMMAQQDAALGVGGPLAQIPGLGVSAADLPGAPGYAGAPAGRPGRPTLLPPVIPDRSAPPQLRLTGYNPEEGGM